jgi:predicted nucleic acid-binding protein
MIVYLDTNICVYLVEDVPGFGAVAESALSQLLGRGHMVVASHLVRMECLVAPLRRGDTAAVAQFDELFGRTLDAMLDFTPAVFNRAAQLRATYSLTTQDALHLAAALDGDCDVFLTNDDHLASFGELRVVLLSSPEAPEG